MSWSITRGELIILDFGWPQALLESNQGCGSDQDRGPFSALPYYMGTRAG